MKNFKKHFFAFLLLLMILSFKFLVFSSFSVVYAQTSHLEQDVFEQATDVGYGDSEPQDPRIIVVKIINVVLMFLSIIFLVLVIISGFQWMTSGGNQDNTKKAKDRIKNAIIGLVIVATSWGVSYFILRRLEAIVEGYQHYADYDLPL